MATYRHKTISRYSVSSFGDERFEFKEGLLVIKTDTPEGVEKHNRFLNLVSQLPTRDQREIVELNEEAMAKLEKPMSKVIRGAQDSGQIPSTVKGPDGRQLPIGARLGVAESPVEPVEEQKPSGDGADLNISKILEEKKAQQAQSTQPPEPPAPLTDEQKQRQAAGLPI